MTTERNPLIDPRYGDVVTSRQSSLPRSRHVVARNGGNVSYQTKVGALVKVCWITTWWDWCKANKAEVEARGTL